ncbi:T6SS effector phospholipase Tle3 domain-containing protein, partial [Burkholderia pseudomallei]|uniref:T6SS effector phospholipase Tle3 domain-containing protein n=1 Tax=Burkholderia pseudomallei TaxID=28450 RepID=UPI00403AEE54
MADRRGGLRVAMAGGLPGVVIFIHGVNDPGAAYATVERGLCQGLNERLSRSDLRPGEYGR